MVSHLGRGFLNVSATNVAGAGFDCFRTKFSERKKFGGWTGIEIRLA